jgi:hypothetical protein
VVVEDEDRFDHDAEESSNQQSAIVTRRQKRFCMPLLTKPITNRFTKRVADGTSQRPVDCFERLWLLLETDSCLDLQ